MSYLIDMDNFSWLSDWNGYEVGHEGISVVGLYQLKETNIYMYIDMETNKVLQYWNETDE